MKNGIRASLIFNYFIYLVAKQLMLFYVNKLEFMFYMLFDS